MIRAELLVDGIGELATLAEGPVPRRGAALGRLGLVHEAAVAVDRGRFVYVGTRRGLRARVQLRSGGLRVDAAGATVTPGFVDAHTHLLFAGDRGAELELKLAGRSYAQIAAAGGGIYSTVRATRRAEDGRLVAQASARALALARSGVTSLEVKSGYCLDERGELRLLSLIPEISRRTGLALVATYLGAHAVPPELHGRPERYVQSILRRVLPRVAQGRLARFCDVFVEPGFFSVRDGERILTRALALGLEAKVHADEFVASGGARLAARLRARSADHCLATPATDRRALARSAVSAVLLPITPFASLSSRRCPGREMVRAGVAVALGSDLSPNSWVESFPAVIAHSVYAGRLTPAEAITAATVNAAHAIGLEETAGVIAPGREADFAIWPLSRATDIAYRIGAHPAAVFRRGVAIPPT